MIKPIVSLLFLLFPILVFAQTYSWSGYTSGSTTYTTGIMTSTVTSTSPSFQYSSPRYFSGTTVGSGQCGIAGGLALECMFGNVTTAHVTLTIDFTSGNTTNGTCASMQFQIKDINADESNMTFRDLVYISAIDGNNANVPVANITATGGSNKYITTSGSSRLIHGSTNASYGSRSQTTCDNVTITVTPPSGVPLKRIVIRYQPSYEAASASTGYWNFTGPYRPAYQYISISSITATATSGCVVLPVELTGFETECKEGKKIFYWQTASETNNDFFTLEASTDGENFIPVKQIGGKGNSSVISDYQTEWEDKENQFRYFRLMQTDFDGNFRYSETRYSDCSSRNEITLYPNPTHSAIHLTGIYNMEIYSWKIYDVTGRMISENNQLENPENETLTMDVRDLHPGCYSLVLYNKTNERLKSIPFIRE